MYFSRGADGSPKLTLKVITLENIYPTASKKPINQDYQNYPCDDEDYLCQANFGWDRVLTAVQDNQYGISYKPLDGLSDVGVQLELTQHESATEDTIEMSSCISEILTRRMQEMQ